MQHVRWPLGSAVGPLTPISSNFMMLFLPVNLQCFFRILPAPVRQLHP